MSAVPPNALMGGAGPTPLRPTQVPAMRFGGQMPPPVPQLPLGALRMPPPVVPPGNIPPYQPTGFEPQPVPEADRISARVPVPKVDFPEAEHQDLHDKTMGAAFDDPEAHKFVRDLYAIVRRSHPDVHPRHLLETTRDSYHAVKHGFMPPGLAGRTLGRMARQRQIMAYAAPGLAQTEVSPPEAEGGSPGPQEDVSTAPETPGD